ncbi:MAG: hypothetical protein C0508_17705 [Cyanobacteria bacterium PR.023]|jgi:hypothetical protein|nr:hypothetical protein [Cyanobacteria bacterium PR.023]MDQ5937449.1 hypothetical protein [Cyanobacteriota bacterium erpe_2018_sw_21hr_WHONDRS-SW48-000092_B_bin.40]
MSQLASAFTLSSDVLDKASKELSERKFDGFWNILFTEAARVNPEYGYSGSLLVIAIEFLLASGIELPMNLTLTATAMQEFQDIGLVVGAQPRAGAETLDLLRRLSFSDEEFAEFYRDYANEEGGADIELAMREGLDFLKRALQQLQSGGDCLIVLIG